MDDEIADLGLVGLAARARREAKQGRQGRPVVPGGCVECLASRSQVRAELDRLADDVDALAVAVLVVCVAVLLWFNRRG